SSIPRWFKARPDGTIQYAENPPKKYQDIYPINFESDDWRGLWAALKGVFEFWIARGVTVFRVDNPHTKAFGFWDWVIGELREETPELIFLAEAFTRPKRMYRLAKGGYTQSYTYFAWRNGPAELRAYVEELASAPVSDFFRPNFWPNTPDILTDYLRDGGRAGSMARFVLAATLVPSFGMYGPSFELCDVRQRPGSEENLDNEKYEIRTWDLDDRWSLRHLIAAVNTIRREHASLQHMTNIAFHDCDNPAHLAYSKTAPDGTDTVLCVVNTNPHEGHGGVVRMNLGAMGIGHAEPFCVVDLLTGREFRWRGPDQFVELGPGLSHVLHVRRESGEPAGVVDAPPAERVRG
ncbi:MAG: alpha-1,4-glucan--maltose-1-phosphate maltosyltransferase, partial [Planctomycetota bacterium]